MPPLTIPRRAGSHLLAVSLAVCLLLAGCLGGSSPYEFNGDAPKAPGPAHLFTLVDQDNENWSLADSEGKVVVLTFIFTRCPDVCIAATSSLLWVQTNLAEADRDEVQFVSVTVDPWYDTTEVLQEYSTNRGADWPHLSVADAGGDARGEEPDRYPQLEAVWGAYGIGLELVGNEDDSDYLIEHSLPTFIIDKSLQKRVVWQGSEWDLESFKQDVEYLVGE